MTCDFGLAFLKERAFCFSITEELRVGVAEWGSLSASWAPSERLEGFT